MNETRRRIRLAGITDESIVDGPGLRYVVFTQGCPHRCAGCHNPQTHDPSDGYEISGADLALRFKKAASDNPLIRGVTISGGEPFMQASSLLSFARQVREAGLGLWIYTGWTVEEIVLRGDPYEITLLGYADAIVDGRFEANKKTLEIPFVGSANQRIITAEEIRFFMERARLDRSARNFTAPAPDRE